MLCLKCVSTGHMPAHHRCQMFDGCAGSHGLWGARQLQGRLLVEECTQRPLARQAIPVAAMARVQAVAALGVVGEGETVLMMQAQATGAACVSETVRFCVQVPHLALPIVCSGKRRGGIWAGWEARCAADSQFAYKVAIEQVRIKVLPALWWALDNCSPALWDLDLSHLAAAFTGPLVTVCQPGVPWAGACCCCTWQAHIRHRFASLLQIIGVGAAVLGDMSSRPYWGLYELDFVFSTLIVSISMLLVS